MLLPICFSLAIIGFLFTNTLATPTTAEALKELALKPGLDLSGLLIPALSRRFAVLSLVNRIVSLSSPHCSGILIHQSVKGNASTPATTVVMGSTPVDSAPEATISAAAPTSNIAQVGMVIATMSTMFPVMCLTFPGCALVPPVFAAAVVKMGVSFCSPGP